MSPSEFLALAQTLQTGTTPAERRTAVSRAYYALFHATRGLLKAGGIPLPEGPECHRQIRDYLGRSGDRLLKALEGELKDLHRNRKRADYDLDETEPEGPKAVLARVASAQRAFDRLAEFEGWPLERRNEILARMRARSSAPGKTYTAR